MIAISEHRLQTLFKEIRDLKVLVLGDLMLDQYHWGGVTRISPEAPVPVVEIESESERLGGATNVCANIDELGATAIPIGIVGDDPAGKTLLRMLKESGFSTQGVIIDEARSTTVKTRVIAHNQHVVRIDKETKHEINRSVQQEILEIFFNQAQNAQAILIEDYNKGLLTKSLISEIVDYCKKNGKILTVDPKFTNFFEYRNVTLFKPNRKETEEVLGVRLKSLEQISAAGNILIQRLQCENVLITLGEKGMLLFERSGEMTEVPVKARKIHDVSGAGDTVISTVTVALAAEATVKEAATLANYAAGIVCGEVGIVPIAKNKLMQAVLGKSE